MMLWADWAQLGCSAPHDVSWHCTHQGFNGAILSKVVQSHGCSYMWSPRGWVPWRCISKISVPKVPGGNCKLSYDWASEVRQFWLHWSSKSLNTLEARAHAIFLSLWLRFSYWMSEERGSSGGLTHIELNCLHPSHFTPPWDVAPDLSYPHDFFLPALLPSDSHSPPTHKDGPQALQGPTTSLLSHSSSAQSMVGMCQWGILLALRRSYDLAL